MKTSVVVTSICAPNDTLRALANGCLERGHSFFVIGDAASPSDFALEGCRFLDLKGQVATGFKFASLCPTRHYARKNVGYLLAAREGCSIIRETDDDNIPYPEFWQTCAKEQSVATLSRSGWTNIYRYFSDTRMWPRGLPLDRVQQQPPAFASLPVTDVICPIQQGLSDNDPDVDAIYRLVGELPQSFRKDRRIALTENSWCPFNSQNTTWWKEVFVLMYLPAYCSFRMTDIWRSFVGQRIAWANQWSVLFHEPTVWQDRNDHNLMRDFKDEIPGYLNNGALCEALESLTLRSGIENLNDNLRLCYEKLVSMELVDPQELVLLEAWIEDLALLSR